MTAQTRIAELEQQHHALEKEITETLKHKSADDLEIVELKRRKLHLKDEIEHLRHSKPFENFTNMTGSVVAQSVEQARMAMKNYLQFLETNLSVLPHVDKDQKAKWMHHAEQNVAAAFEFAEKLTHVKDIQDVARIQTEFVQKQMKSLSEQAKYLGEAASKAATGAFKGGSS